MSKLSVKRRLKWAIQTFKSVGIWCANIRNSRLDRVWAFLPNIGVPRGDESFLEHIFHALDGRGVPPESREPFLKLLLDLKADPTPLLTGKI